MKSFTCLMIGILLLTGLAEAQTSMPGGEQDLLKQLKEKGMNLEADSLLTVNYYKLLTRNSQDPGVPGYRIRIFSESGLGAKEQQLRIRARFLSLYPDVDAYNRYDAPYFKLYVGDCRTRSEALALFERIRKDFPNPIIVEDHIQLR